MAIKDRWNRFVSRKSASSTSSSTADSPPATAVVSAPAAAGHRPSRPPTNNTTTSAGSDTPKPTTGFFSKTRGWRSRLAANRQEQRPPKSTPAAQKLHPSERSLTETNLHHQEMLSAFTMQFGRTRRFSGGTAFSGVSPGCSRRPSRDVLAGGVGPDEQEGGGVSGGAG